jgi:hypothetical protein
MENEKDSDNPLFRTEFRKELAEAIHAHAQWMGDIETLLKNDKPMTDSEWDAVGASVNLSTEKIKRLLAMLEKPNAS